TQLVRLRAWPHCPTVAWTLVLLFASLTVVAAVNDASVPAAGFGVIVLLLMGRAVHDCGITMQAIRRAIVVCGLLDERQRTRVAAPANERATAFEANHERV